MNNGPQTHGADIRKSCKHNSSWFSSVCGDNIRCFWRKILLSALTSPFQIITQIKSSGFGPVPSPSMFESVENVPDTQNLRWWHLLKVDKRYCYRVIWNPQLTFNRLASRLCFERQKYVCLLSIWYTVGAEAMFNEPSSRFGLRAKVFNLISEMLHNQFAVVLLSSITSW